MSTDLALDFGTATTRVVNGHGVVLLEEPTLAAVDDNSGRLVAFGSEALGLPQNGAGRVRLVRPVRHGQLADLAVAEDALGEVLRRAGASRIAPPRVLVCVPVGATQVQRRALERALRHAGVRQVRFVEQPVACAVASDLRIEEPAGTMVVDIGAGTSDVAVLALGGIATSASVALGGDDLDDAIRLHLARRHGLVVDPDVAAEVRAAIGTVDERAGEAHVEVLGRDQGTGRTRSAILARSELRPILAELVAPVLAAAVASITDAPPDLANDLLGAGLVLAGGGALLDGLDRRLASATGVPVHVSPLAGRCAVLGASRCLSMLDVLVGALSEAHRR